MTKFSKKKAASPLPNSKRRKFIQENTQKWGYRLNPSCKKYKKSDGQKSALIDKENMKPNKRINSSQLTEPKEKPHQTYKRKASPNSILSKSILKREIAKNAS